MRTIQYAVAHWFSTAVSGILDHPPEPVIGLAEGETRWRVIIVKQDFKPASARGAAARSVRGDSRVALPNRSREMPTIKRRAFSILNEYGAAQSELIGKAVVLSDAKAGTVEHVWLDELHGLRISIAGHDGRWPVSTIRFWQG
jgi:hypothetical protein